MSVKNRAILYNTIMVLLSFIMVFPILWWIAATFKTAPEISSGAFFAKEPTLDNYISGWQFSDQYTMAKFYVNSLFIEFFNVTGAVITSSLVAFGFARMKFKLKEMWFSILLLTLMLPGQVTVVSQFIMYNKLGMVNTYIPLILPYVLGGGAFFVFLLVQFIRGIPLDLDEAATIDGAGIFTIYSRVVLPLLKTPLVTIGLFAFLWSWDDFYSHLLYISSVEKFTVGLALRMFIDQYEIQWGKLLAMSLISIVPSMLLFFSAQKHFVAGIATTGIKG